MQVFIFPICLEAITFENSFFKNIDLISVLLGRGEIKKVWLSFDGGATSHIICFEKSARFLVRHENVLLIFVVYNYPLRDVFYNHAHFPIKSLIIPKLHEHKFCTFLTIVGRY